VAFLDYRFIIQHYTGNIKLKDGYRDKAIMKRTLLFDEKCPLIGWLAQYGYPFTTT
jgi:hypothetical protein